MKRHATVMLIALGTLLTAAACAPPPPPPPADTLRTPRPGATPSASPSTLYSREAAQPDPNFDTGYTVLVTSSGFQPAMLVAPCCQAVTWKNTTSSPVTVVFNAVVGGSGEPIPPGGIYVFAPHNVESVAYHAGEDHKLTGVVQVNQLPQ